MKKNVYFLRHGESLENLSGIRMREDEAVLTKSGLNQAESVASRMSSIDLDIVYSSPYDRAVKTAEKIAQDSDVEMEIIEFGYERLYPKTVYGLLKKDSKAEDIVDSFKKVWIKSPDMVAGEESESFNEFKNRIGKILKLAEKSKMKNIAFVLHGSILKALLIYILTDGNFNADTFFKMYKRLSYSNTGLSLFQYVNNKEWKIKIWNDYSHL